MEKIVLPRRLGELADAMEISKEGLREFQEYKGILNLFKEYNQDERSLSSVEREVSTLYFRYSNTIWENNIAILVDYLADRNK